MSASVAELAAAKQLITQIVDPGTGVVRTSSLAYLTSLLQAAGFNKFQDVPYGPPGGRQLFFKYGRVIVRVKTKGDDGGFRANQPHMSVALTDGDGVDWFNELAKFNRQGELAAKAMTSADRFKPVDQQGNPQRFVVIMGGLYNGSGPDAWASRTHFTFAGNVLNA